MDIKKIKRISDLMYYATIIFAIIVIGKNYYDRWKLPEGVCPVNNNYGMIIFSIVLLIVSFVTTTFIDRKNKTSIISDKNEVKIDKPEQEEK